MGILGRRQFPIEIHTQSLKAFARRGDLPTHQSHEMQWQANMGKWQRKKKQESRQAAKKQVEREGATRIRAPYISLKTLTFMGQKGDV